MVGRNAVEVVGALCDALRAAAAELKAYALEDAAAADNGYGCRGDPFGSIEPVVQQVEAALALAERFLAQP